MEAMNGLGVGGMVGLGAVIGPVFNHIYLQPLEAVATFLFYGLWAGIIFEVWKWALQGVQFPPRRGQP